MKTNIILKIIDYIIIFCLFLLYKIEWIDLLKSDKKDMFRFRIKPRKIVITLFYVVMSIPMCFLDGYFITKMNLKNIYYPIYNSNFTIKDKKKILAYKKI